LKCFRLGFRGFNDEELRGCDRLFRSISSHHSRTLVTTSGGWDAHAEEKLLGASAEAIAFWQRGKHDREGMVKCFWDAIASLLDFQMRYAIAFWQRGTMPRSDEFNRT